MIVFKPVAVKVSQSLSSETQTADLHTDPYGVQTGYDNRSKLGNYSDPLYFSGTVYGQKVSGIEVDGTPQPQYVGTVFEGKAYLGKTNFGQVDQNAKYSGSLDGSTSFTDTQTNYYLNGTVIDYHEGLVPTDPSGHVIEGPTLTNITTETVSNEAPDPNNDYTNTSQQFSTYYAYVWSQIYVPVETSALNINNADKIEQQTLDLGTTTGQQSINGTIGFTDTDTTATQNADVEPGATATATDANGNVITLTSAQQAALTGAFKIASLSTAGASGTGSVGWTYDPGTTDLSFLTAGETAQVTSTVKVSDTDGNIDTSQVAVAVNGSALPTVSIFSQYGSGINVTEGGSAGSVIANLSAPSSVAINVHTALSPSSDASQIQTLDFVIPAGVTSWTAPVVYATDNQVVDDTQTGNLVFSATNADGLPVSFFSSAGDRSTQNVSLSVYDAITAPMQTSSLIPTFDFTKKLILYFNNSYKIGAPLYSIDQLGKNLLKGLDSVAETYGVVADIGSVAAQFSSSINSININDDPTTQAVSIYNAEENAIVGVADLVAKQALAHGTAVTIVATIEALTEGAATPALPVLIPAIDVTAGWSTDAVYEDFLKEPIESYVRQEYERVNDKNAFVSDFVAVQQGIVVPDTSTTDPAVNDSPEPSEDGESSSNSSTLPTTSAASQDSNVTDPVLTQNSDGSTTTKTVQANGDIRYDFANLASKPNQHYSSYSDIYASDGTLLNEVRNMNDGSHSISVKAPGQTLQSDVNDTFYAAQQGSTTFVFQPGEELGVVKGFKIGGADHDTVSLLGSDFHNSIADVLRNTIYTAGGATIFDTVSGDIVRLANVTEQQLNHNKKDITFHS